jgi:hypothetical protein
MLVSQVYQKLVHVMIDHLVAIFSPSSSKAKLPDAKKELDKVIWDTKQFAEDLDEKITDYLFSGYKEFSDFQCTPEESPNLEELREAWLARQKTFLQDSKLLFSQIQNACNAVTPTWTRYKSDSFQLLQPSDMAPSRRLQPTIQRRIPSP